MDLMQDIIARAKADKQRIVLPEGTEERTLKAADRLLADGVADIILIGNPAEIKELASGFGLNHIGEATLVGQAFGEIPVYLQGGKEEKDVLHVKGWNGVRDGGAERRREQ